MLVLPHPAKDDGAPELSNTEQDVQNGSDDFERQSPSVPQSSEQPHDHGRLDGRARHLGDACGAENPDEEGMVVRIEPVQYDGKMRPKLGKHVKGACEIKVSVFSLSSSLHGFQGLPRLQCRQHELCTYPIQSTGETRS